ncbi:MAG: hypothetical protein RLZZ40_754 [Actinomycetota bacterium]
MPFRWVMQDLRGSPVGCRGRSVVHRYARMLIGVFGAVGSALPSHGRGRRFESGITHKFIGITHRAFRHHPRGCRFGNLACSRIESRMSRKGHADVAQLVAHHLAKVRVASSSLVIRSEKPQGQVPHGGVAERRGSGLQSRPHGFKSRRHLATTSYSLGRLAQR